MALVGDDECRGDISARWGASRSASVGSKAPLWAPVLTVGGRCSGLWDAGTGDGRGIPPPRAACCSRSSRKASTPGIWATAGCTACLGCAAAGGTVANVPDSGGWVVVPRPPKLAPSEAGAAGGGTRVECCCGRTIMRWSCTSCTRCCGVSCANDSTPNGPDVGSTLGMVPGAEDAAEAGTAPPADPGMVCSLGSSGGPGVVAATPPWVGRAVPAAEILIGMPLSSEGGTDAAGVPATACGAAKSWVEAAQPPGAA